MRAVLLVLPTLGRRGVLVGVKTNREIKPHFWQVEFLPAAALTAEELERQRLAADAAAKATR